MVGLQPCSQATQSREKWPGNEASRLAYAYNRGVDKFIGVGGLGWKVRARNFWSVRAQSARDFFFSVKARVIF